jgi:hypothetical protein
MSMLHNSLAAAAFAVAMPMSAWANPANPMDAYRGYVVAKGAGWTLNIHPKQPMYLSFEAGETIEAAAVAPAAASNGAVQFAGKPIKATFRETGDCKIAGQTSTYPLEVTVTANGKTHKGCGYLRWDNDIQTLIPAIDACLAKAKVKGPVTWAKRESDSAMVRVEGRNTNTTMCQVDLTGGKAAIVKARDVSQAAPELGERDPIFYRAPAENPGGECYEAPSVKDANGKHLGWIDGDEGC